MINTTKVEILVNRIIDDHNCGYCPLHFEGPKCEIFGEQTPKICKECIMRWLSTI